MQVVKSEMYYDKLERECEELRDPNHGKPDPADMPEWEDGMTLGEYTRLLEHLGYGGVY